ncbi:MAG: type II toxin-antitoxin system RelE/ParE family toxin [Aquisalimonadaceae bacterium]
MIKSFASKHTQALFEGRHVPQYQVFRRQAERKLQMLDSATTLDFLRSPPGNRLEALRGDRQGHYSIRINGQWRLCFLWQDGDAHNVEIVDYH